VTQAAPPPPPAPARPTISAGARLARSPATFGLIGFTAFVFLLQTLSNQLLGADLVELYGAKINSAIAQGQVWRLVTPLFVHAGLPHVFVNMYSLFAIGPAVERFFGSRRMLAIYLLSGIGGVVLSLAASPSASVGASGAIFGLLGALAAFLYQHRTTFGRGGRRILVQLVVVALLNLGLGLMPGIDDWGHLGGLIAGTALTLFLGPRYEPAWVDTVQAQLVDRRPWSQVWPGMVFAAGLLGGLTLLALLSPVNR
jgi:rhomboid protease GluP